MLQTRIIKLGNGSEKYGFPVVTIVGEEESNEQVGQKIKKYYYALVRYGDDGAEHLCVDKTMSLTDGDLKLLDDMIFTQIGNNYLFRGIIGNGQEDDPNTILSTFPDSEFSK